ISVLEKSEAAAGFEQIINFLSGSYIQHAFTINPHVYISCIKQFWNTAVVKHSARMGYEKPSTKLTFYKAFFSSQWKFLIHSLLHSLSAKQTSWNEFSSAMASALICLSTEQVAAAAGTSHIADDVAQPTSPLPPSPVIPSTPPHQSPSPPQPQPTKETTNVAQQLEIIKLKARLKKLESLNKVKSSKLRRLKKVATSQRVESSEDIENVFNQGRISVYVDEGIELEVDQKKSAEVKGRQAYTQTEICNIDLDHSSKVLSMQEDIEVQEVVEVVNAAKLITEVVTAAATQVAVVSAPVLAAKPKVLKIAA
nr:hypothetical protein [Tanacetum cinerariifolium]